MTPDPYVKRLRRLDVCAVSDALDRLKLSGVVTGVPQQSGQGKIAGRVVTFKVGLGAPPPGSPRHLGTAAVEAAGADNVIVVEQRSGLDAGCWGGLLTLAAKVRTVAGVVADGPVRDIDEARAYGFPVFGRKLTAKTARGRVVELGVDVPIHFEEIQVYPGDYVIADASGVAFVSASAVAQVLDAAEMIADREAVMARALLAGVTVSEVMGGDYEHMLRA